MKDDLISRSAFAEEIESLEITVAGKPARWYDAKHSVLRCIAEAPAVDAVEVVRCRECKHCLVDLSGREAHLCMRMENGWPLRRRRNADDFCSFGERKEHGPAE